MARSRSALGAFACTIIVTSAAVAPCIGVASAAVRTAYLWADRPGEASYVANAAYASATATGARIERTAPGRYSVSLGGFLSGAGSSAPGRLGNIQVSAYGDTGGFCQVVSWGASASVACFNSGGAPEDMRFSLLATVADAGDPVAYAFAGRPAEASYDASPSYSMRDSGAVRITRTRIGSYIAALGNATAGIGGTVQATAYGATPRRCKTGGWILGAVTVLCTDAAGRPADSAFTVLSMKPAAASRDFAYLWSGDPGAATPPDSRFAFAPEATGGADVTKTAAGRYSVRLGARIHNVQVTAYGADSAYCNPVSWSTSTVNVACHAPGGGAVDARFTVLAVNSDAARDLFVDFLPVPLPTAAPPLFGYVDLHTHPASFLGFGGDASGRRGMMWGRPRFGATRGEDARRRFQQCFPDDHSPERFDAIEDPTTADPNRLVQQELRKIIMSTADDRTRFPHSNSGSDRFSEWPNSLIVSHQQIDIDWLRRAHQGGLRAIVAAAVDNEIIDTAFDMNFDSLTPLLRDFFAGRPLRPALGMPRAGFAFTSAREQLRAINEMVSDPGNCAFMEIALSAADARRIVSEGKMAVILGLEYDTLTPAEIERLVDEDGVRFVTPIHFVDNQIGGSAAYEAMFSLLNGVVGVNGQPHTFAPNRNLDFFLGNEFGESQDAINSLTRSALGWAPIGADCAVDSRTDGRLGCAGQGNSRGLAPAGVTLINRLLRRGVMVDLAHMSALSQDQALDRAEAARMPVFNSHTGMRADTFSLGANERAMAASDARRLLDLGGVIGVGTGTGELDDPRRIYYNAGNPLIDFRNRRSVWEFDLRQPEAQQVVAPGRFTQYRVTLRIGSDNVESQNSITATLLTRTGEITPSCVVVPEGAGVAGHAPPVSRLCTLPAARSLDDINGLKLQHTARNCDVCTPDNVNIDEVILEANLIGDPRGFITVLQRTGGHESEVVRLKAPGPESDTAFASHMWTTRLLPRAGDLGGSIAGLQVRTFTNEDDLGGSAPARISLSFSGHREATSADDLVFAASGAPAGTFTNDRLAFRSGGEGLISRPDRAQALSFGAVTLTVGAREEDEIIAKIAALRAAADSGAFLLPEVQASIGLAVGGLAAAVPGAVGWAIADPITAGISALIIWALIESHDNWSSLVAIDAVIAEGGGRERRTPFLVGYNPVQRIKGSEPASTLFRGLPERIEANRRYGGLVVNYALTKQDGTTDVPGNSLEAEIVFTDGETRRISGPASFRIGFGAERRMVIPFDRVRLGRELRTFRLRATRDNILVRSLDIGLITDPAESFADAFAAFDNLGAHTGQIAYGTDLSGFEALVPFSAITEGLDPLIIPEPCPGRVVSGECTIIPGAAPPERAPRITLPAYSIDVERTAGRSDPARSIPARGVPSSLGVARVIDGDASTRLLDFRESGLSTVGQLPDLSVAAHQADRLRRGTRASLGPQLFSSVDSFVRAWERLDAGASAGAPPRPAGVGVCRP